MKRPKPVQSAKERDELITKLAPTVANRFKVPVDEAKKRLLGLSRSGLLSEGSPDDPRSQMAIDMFLSLPSKVYED